MGQTLSYETLAGVGRKGKRRIAACSVAAACFIAAINACLLYFAWSDGSWGALGIMLAVGPIANVVLAILTPCLFPFVRRYSGEKSVTPYVLTSIIMPVAAIFIDAACIMSMQLHGC